MSEAGGGRRGRGLVVAGGVLAAVGLVVGVLSGVFVAMSVGGPLAETFTSPPRSTPVDVQLSLDAGRHTVYELVGRRSTEGPVTTTTRDEPTVTPEAVVVTGPDGVALTVSGYGSSSETMTRDDEVYEGVARFTVAEPGLYDVRIDAPAGGQVVVAPSFGSGFGDALRWLLAGVAGIVALVVGVILVVVGVLRRRRRPAAGIPVPYTATPAGWYPAPDAPHRQRYWDGRAWTGHLR